ncbi:hypothetical protein TWF718_010910 [Orbilia javanica]|uniref:Uncharacterized protein n=1 Tax=Orbilia javanica TaxID=47235 RepID=A0AAN8NN31_9PEZI
MKFKSIIPLLSVILTTIKPCIAPDPIVSSPTAQIEIPIVEYRGWIAANFETFSSIYDELRRFLLARKETCAIYPPAPDSTYNVNIRTTLGHYVFTIEILLHKVGRAIEVAKNEPADPSKDTALVTLMRRLYDGTWGPAEEIETVLDRVIEIISDSITELIKLDSDVSEFVKVPPDPTTLAPGYTKADAISHYFALPKWSTAHPPNTILLVDPGRKDAWLENFVGMSDDISVLSTFMYSFSNSALDDGLDNPAYTEVLNTPDYNPNFGVEGARPYTPIDVFRNIRAWYECWAQPIREIVRLGELVTPLPGSPESEILQIVNNIGGDAGSGAEAA